MNTLGWKAKEMPKVFWTATFEEFKGDPHIVEGIDAEVELPNGKKVMVNNINYRGTNGNQHGWFGTMIFMLCFCVSAAFAAELPPAPAPQPVADSYGFHRGEDVTFGLLISAPVGMASRPWIGLLAGEAAGIANEARYGKNFNKTHLVYISAGALAGYGLAKWEKHVQRKVDAKKNPYNY